MGVGRHARALGEDPYAGLVPIVIEQSNRGERSFDIFSRLLRERIVFVTGFVNAVDGFTESPAVINGASDLFLKVFGDAGKHARAAVAVNGLPRGSTTEVQVVVEVKP